MYTDWEERNKTVFVVYDMIFYVKYLKETITLEITPGINESIERLRIQKSTAFL